MTSFIDELNEEQRKFVDDSLDAGTPYEVIAMDLETKQKKKVGKSSIQRYSAKRRLSKLQQVDLEGIPERDLENIEIDIVEIVETDLKKILKIEHKRDLTATEMRTKSDLLKTLADWKLKKLEDTKKRSISFQDAIKIDPVCPDCSRPYTKHVCPRDTDIAGNPKPFCPKCATRHFPTAERCPQSLSLAT